MHPVAGLSDLAPRHIVRSRLLGQELAVWRADDGFINVWADRCIHRGVRLSVGINDGAELVCQYHGWRYSNRNGDCSYIPAHPGEAPARGMCVPTFASAVKYGLVWSGGSLEAGPPEIAALAGQTTLALRALPVNAPAALALERLAGDSFQPAETLGSDAAATRAARSDSPFSVTVTAAGAGGGVVCFVQPADADRCVIRPVLAPAPPPAQRLAVLRHHAARLEELRGELESSVPSGVSVQDPSAAPRASDPRDVARGGASEVAVAVPAVKLQPLPRRRTNGSDGPGPDRRPELEVSVARKWLTAEGVAAFDLAPISGELPSFQPGAHVDVHLPGGLVRQYSLTNGPQKTDVYRIGVKLEPDSRGGSKYMHAGLHEGDTLGISLPHNNFPLRRDAARTLLIAGGIGLTPLVAMAQTLARQGLVWEFHYFAQSEAHVAFGELLDPLGAGVSKHLGLSPSETAAELAGLAGDYAPAHHLYVCGPSPMIEATRTIAAEVGWPESAVHFEYFKNESDQDDSSTFEVFLARRNQTLTIGEGTSILESLRGAGVDMPSSCEQGVCGTCIVTVLEGAPDHQDVYFSDGEREAGDRLLTCVSRAAGKRLVLDL